MDMESASFRAALNDRAVVRTQGGKPLDLSDIRLERLATRSEDRLVLPRGIGEGREHQGPVLPDPAGIHQTDTEITTTTLAVRRPSPRTPPGRIFPAGRTTFERRFWDPEIARGRFTVRAFTPDP